MVPASQPKLHTGYYNPTIRWTPQAAYGRRECLVGLNYLAGFSTSTCSTPVEPAPQDYHWIPLLPQMSYDGGRPAAPLLRLPHHKEHLAPNSARPSNLRNLRHLHTTIQNLASLLSLATWHSRSPGKSRNVGTPWSSETNITWPRLPYPM
jgi:hypothetical protein